ncbi:hypothetical protein VIGAN_10015900 [Vigna angularis var. angularis]|uniref:Uncharacterized protein n=1 Tax=Vigna angularis var. angularis TaxID=157739 RepID=A0A0S3T0X3_PHAAN|nr:hypothetical protein VIGAN_10015900 [Vigna angularis var. angularis]
MQLRRPAPPLFPATLRQQHGRRSGGNHPARADSGTTSLSCVFHCSCRCLERKSIHNTFFLCCKVSGQRHNKSSLYISITIMLEIVLFHRFSFFSFTLPWPNNRKQTKLNSSTLQNPHTYNNLCNTTFFCFCSNLHALLLL